MAITMDLYSFGVSNVLSDQMPRLNMAALWSPFGKRMRAIMEDPLFSFNRNPQRFGVRNIHPNPLLSFLYPSSPKLWEKINPRTRKKFEFVRGVEDNPYLLNSTINIDSDLDSCFVLIERLKIEAILSNLPEEWKTNYEH